MNRGLKFPDKSALERQHMATDRKPQQLPGESGAEVTQRLQLMVKNIEEANGHHPVVSAYYQIKATIVLMQRKFKEQK